MREEHFQEWVTPSSGAGIRRLRGIIACQPLTVPGSCHYFLATIGGTIFLWYKNLASLNSQH